MGSVEKDKKMPVTVSGSSMEEKEKEPVMTRQGAYAAVSYMATAVLLVMFNKAVLSSYSFPYANVVTLFQMLCSCTLLYAMKCWNMISFTTGELQSKSNNPATLVSFGTLSRTFPLAFSYLLYMLVTMESVRGINVPMYTTLRRTTVAFTMLVEYLLSRKKHSMPVILRDWFKCKEHWCNFLHVLIPKIQIDEYKIHQSWTKGFISVGIIILGAIAAGARDLSFDVYGYGVVFVANICTAIYLASIARIGKSSGLNSFGLMWCNGIICGPILLLWTLIRGDLQTMMDFPFLLSPGFQVVMLFSCLMAFLINYFVFLNTTLNSALTQTICGNLKDLFTIGLGWVLFGGLPFEALNVAGQSLGFLGSCLYAYCKLQGK